MAAINVLQAHQPINWVIFKTDGSMLPLIPKGTRAKPMVVVPTLYPIYPIKAIIA
jgi:hypothetical protein